MLKQTKAEMIEALVSTVADKAYWRTVLQTRTYKQLQTQCKELASVR